MLTNHPDRFPPFYSPLAADEDHVGSVASLLSQAEHGPSDQPAVVKGARHGPTVRGARAEASDDAMQLGPAPGSGIPPHAAASRETRPPTGWFQRPMGGGSHRVLQHQEESLGEGMGAHAMLDES